MYGATPTFAFLYTCLKLIKPCPPSCLVTYSRLSFPCLLRIPFLRTVSFTNTSRFYCSFLVNWFTFIACPATGMTQQFIAFMKFLSYSSKSTRFSNPFCISFLILNITLHLSNWFPCSNPRNLWNPSFSGSSASAFLSSIKPSPLIVSSEVFGGGQGEHDPLLRFLEGLKCFKGVPKSVQIDTKVVVRILWVEKRNKLK